MSAMGRLCACKNSQSGKAKGDGRKRIFEFTQREMGEGWREVKRRSSWCRSKGSFRIPVRVNHPSRTLNLRRCFLIDFASLLPSTFLLRNYCRFSSHSVHFGGFFSCLSCIFVKEILREKARITKKNQHLWRLAFCAWNSSLIVHEALSNSVTQMSSRVDVALSFF